MRAVAPRPHARRLLLAPLVLLALIGTLFAPPGGAAVAADPASGTVSADEPVTRWEGGPFVTSNPVGCLPGLDPSCDVFELTVDAPEDAVSQLVVAIETADEADDLDLFVYDSDGQLVGSGATPGGNESVTIDRVESGVYEVVVQAWLVTPATTYEGTAALSSRDAAPPADELDDDTVVWSYDSDDAQVSATVPLHVVMIGFEEDDPLLAEQQDAILGEVPPTQRPGSLFRYHQGSSGFGDDGDLFGVDTLVNHGRSYYRDNKPFLLPIEFAWEPQFHVADADFSEDFFGVMAEGIEFGTFSDEMYTLYLEHYNLRRGLPGRLGSGGAPVAPGSEVAFVDALSVEDWLAENAGERLGVAASDTPGEAGYTVFFINSYDGPGTEQLPQDSYHVFKIERPSPDIEGVDAGIDWARIWGGRYRFMMVDLGAAPNPYEAESWGNNRRSVWGSAGYEPPIWEYRAGLDRTLTPVHLADGIEQAVTPGEFWDAEQFGAVLGRTVNQAISFRFLHSYLYEPRPGTGRFFLSDNVWHDENAMVPFESDLTKLYDQEAALEGLSTLTPYFEFGGDVAYQYLASSDEFPEYADDQAALESFKQAGDDIAGAPYSAMNTLAAMDYVDANPERFLRGGECFTTVPTLQIVVEKHYAWALPVIVAGIAPSRDGVPWGFLNSVSDLTKWPGATKDPMMAAIHPDLFSGTFTYTTVHEASHYLGLAHPHDTIGATVDEDGETLYYDGFTWAYNSTAAPTTYSHEEMSYSVLDQETIARGHTSFYLQWTNEVLAETGIALLEDGVGTVSDLDPELATLRQQAIDGIELARQRFADFEFVEATFAAQDAWLAASSFRDEALELEPGTTEFEHGTRNDPAVDPAECGTDELPDDDKLTGRDRAEQAKEDAQERREGKGGGHQGKGGGGQGDDEARHEGRGGKPVGSAPDGVAREVAGGTATTSTEAAPAGDSGGHDHGHRSTGPQDRLTGHGLGELELVDPDSGEVLAAPAGRTHPHDDGTGRSGFLVPFAGLLIGLALLLHHRVRGLGRS